MNKKLKRQIEKHLERLQTLIETIGNHDINPDDSEMWDSDYYYDLAEQLKEALKMLEGQKQTNRYGQELILEEGLCSLIDDYQTAQEEEEEYE